MTTPRPQPMPFELGTDGPSTVVVGVDGSDSSWRALHYALGVARRQHARVIAVFAHHVPALAYGGLDPQLPAAEGASFDDDRHLAEVIAALGRDHHVPTAYCSARGDPATAIGEAAERHRADLIVVGASQHTGHRYFGSTSQRIIRSGRYPVTVVP